MENMQFMLKYIKLDIVKKNSNEILQDIDKAVDALRNDFQVKTDLMLAKSGELGGR